MVHALAGEAHDYLLGEIAPLLAGFGGRIPPRFLAKATDHAHAVANIQKETGRYLQAAQLFLDIARNKPEWNLEPSRPYVNIQDSKAQGCNNT